MLLLIIHPIGMRSSKLVRVDILIKWAAQLMHFLHYYMQTMPIQSEKKSVEKVKSN